MLVTVKYLGKRLPITLSMPWLEQHVTFNHDRLGQMAERDAVKLCSECPRDFQIVEEAAPPVVVEKPPEEVIEPTIAKTVSKNKKRQSRKKE